MDDMDGQGCHYHSLHGILCTWYVNLESWERNQPQAAAKSFTISKLQLKIQEIAMAKVDTSRYLNKQSRTPIWLKHVESL